MSEAPRSEEELKDLVLGYLERAVSGQPMPLTLRDLDEADRAFRILNDWMEAQSVTGVEVGRPGQGRRLTFKLVGD